ncbi:MULTISPECIES: hypothetical protein [Listeria]|nr:MULTISPECIES: hypothetical protein [Listeria]
MALWQIPLNIIKQANAANVEEEKILLWGEPIDSIQLESISNQLKK